MFIKKYNKGERKIIKILGGFIKIVKMPAIVKYYILGIRVFYKKDLLKELELKKWNNIYNYWRFTGVTDEFMISLKLIFNNPAVLSEIPSRIWLVFISSMIEKNLNNEVRKFLKLYLNSFGLKDIKNYFYLSEFMCKNKLTEDKEILRTAKIWEKLNNKTYVEKFRNYLKGKRIAVVGNSGCELGKNKGEEIDSHDVVIRFANYPTDEKYFCDYGKKTTIWVRNISKDIVHKPNISKYDYVIWKGSVEHLYMEDKYLDIMYKYLFEDVSKLVLTSQTTRSELNEKYSIYYPTAGCEILWELYSILGKIDNIDVYGFSFLAKDYTDTKHYYDNKCNLNNSQHFSVGHDLSMEIDFLSEIFNK